MSNRKSLKSAFSLIELSIVILIIGILIAGVTQGSRLVNAYKLQTARTLTNSSPVSSIRNLSLWLDAASETTFLNQSGSVDIANGDTVSSWKDSNPLITTPTFCTQGTTGNQPTYVSNAVNGLPGVRFTISNGEMRLICSPNSNFNMENTIFIVFKWVSSFTTSNTNFLVIDSPDNIEATMTTVLLSGALTFINWNGAANIDILSYSLTSGTNLVMTRYSNPSLNSSALYVNGASVSTSTSSISGVFTNPRITIGNYPVSTRTLGGDIAEIIIYERALKNEERQAVEKYLGQKWGIKIN